LGGGVGDGKGGREKEGGEGEGGGGRRRTSGMSCWLGLSRSSYSTSTLVSGLRATPASMPTECIYDTISRGLVFRSEAPAGVSAAVEERAASWWKV